MLGFSRGYRFCPVAVLAAAVALLSLVSTVGLFAAESARPNIVYIMVDDLGYGDLGCYGQKEIATPNIDRLAAEGMRFTDHYAGCTVCAPSRCSLMTGLHTGHAYIRGNRETKPMGQEPLPDETITVAERLQDTGYRTALVGKWGLGGPGSVGTPNRQGFDYFFGYLCQRHAHNFYPEFLFRNDQRVPLEGNVVDNNRGDGAGEASQKVTYSADVIADEAVAFIERNKDKPFFLYCAMTPPHANNEAGRRGMEVPSYGRYADRDWPEPQKGHAAMITRMDGHVGRIVETLDRLGLTEETLVLFTSDNGPHREGGNNPDFNDSNGPLRGIKRDLYEGGIRVPLIAFWPGKIEAGSETDLPSAFWDFLPTACALAGVDPPSDIDGISYLPTLLGRTDDQKTHDYLYWEFKRMRAVRFGPWKAIFTPPSKVELYNLDDDLAETTDIAAEHPEIVEQAKSYLRAGHVESELFPIPPVE